MGCRARDSNASVDAELRPACYMAREFLSYRGQRRTARILRVATYTLAAAKLPCSVGIRTPAFRWGQVKVPLRTTATRLVSKLGRARLRSCRMKPAEEWASAPEVCFLRPKMIHEASSVRQWLDSPEARDQSRPLAQLAKQSLGGVHIGPARVGSIGPYRVVDSLRGFFQIHLQRRLKQIEARLQPVVTHTAYARCIVTRIVFRRIRTAMRRGVA